jgi:hypothetical protein
MRGASIWWRRGDAEAHRELLFTAAVWWVTYDRSGLSIDYSSVCFDSSRHHYEVVPPPETLPQKNASYLSFKCRIDPRYYARWVVILYRRFGTTYESHTTLRCIISQKSTDLIYIAAETWNHASAERNAPVTRRTASCKRCLLWGKGPFKSRG